MVHYPPSVHIPNADTINSMLHFLRLEPASMYVIDVGKWEVRLASWATLPAKKCIFLGPFRVYCSLDMCTLWWWKAMIYSDFPIALLVCNHADLVATEDSHTYTHFWTSYPRLVSGTIQSPGR